MMPLRNAKPSEGLLADFKSVLMKGPYLRKPLVLRIILITSFNENILVVAFKA
jgi:hypothetical protein